MRVFVYGSENGQNTLLWKVPASKKSHHGDALAPSTGANLNYPAGLQHLLYFCISNRLWCFSHECNQSHTLDVAVSPCLCSLLQYRYLPAGSWGTKCQGDKQDLPALWAGRGAAPHPGLPAEPSPHLNSVSHTLSGFWSPPARLTHRLSKEKAKKKRKGKGKGKRKKKAIPSQDACALSLKGWRTVLAAAIQPTDPAEGGEDAMALWSPQCGELPVHSVGAAGPCSSSLDP